MQRVQTRAHASRRALLSRPAGGIAGILLALCVGQSARAVVYVEDFETHPGGTGYAYIRNSPNGLSYDFYPARAFPRLAGFPITVLGTGDEGFGWGNNTFLPAPKYGLPGGVYSSNPTNYLFNAYGTGYDPWDLGINFTAGPTVLHSLDFGLANGSNAPTHGVTVNGFLGGVQIWSASTGVGGNVTLATPGAAVDRIEIVRAHNTEPLFSQFPLGWYTLDNLSYEIAGDPTGGYAWTYYTEEEFLAPFSAPVPEPGAYALMILGFGALGGLLRRRRAASVGIVVAPARS